MKIATPDQMREIDSIAIENIGIPGIVLMENAATEVVKEITRSLGEIRGKSILILAGKGNNGGDAFAAARHLHNQGANVGIFITASKAEIKGDASANLSILDNMGIPTVELANPIFNLKFTSFLLIADLVVDGIFGTGFRGNVKEPLDKIINDVNKSKKLIISIDIPSGIDGSSGKAAEPSIRADKTVTLVLPKTGLVIHPGCEYTGDLVVADIGIPPEAINDLGIKINLTDEQIVSGLIPLRNKDSNKGDYGKILIITGSKGMTGAGCLAGSAALRSGSGLVYLGVPKSLAGIYNTVIKEAVVLPLEDEDKGYILKDNVGALIESLKGKTAVAVGPGLSVNEDITGIVKSIIESSTAPLVLDADALNAISQNVSILKKRKAEVVVTPHPGEMSRLTGLTIPEIQGDRLGVAQRFAKENGVITVLKGSKTVIAVPDGTVYINPTGNVGMATAGMGDVLTGLIASLIGQGLKPADASVAGVYIHGLAGDEAALEKGYHGLIAGDLVEQLPYTIKKLNLF